MPGGRGGEVQPEQTMGELAAGSLEKRCREVRVPDLVPDCTLKDTGVNVSMFLQNKDG